MDRLGEILQKLNERHTPEDFNVEESKQRLCDWENEREGNLHEIDGYNCSLCKNKGYIAEIGKNGFETHVVCKCDRIRETLRRARRSGLGNILTDYTFDKYIVTEEWQQKIKTTAQVFCQDDTAHWFYMGGQTGAGKTHICTAIAAHYIKQGRECKYMLWRDDAVKLKATANDYETYQSLIKPFKEVEVLYIDDFLKVMNGADPTPADINVAFEILNYRLHDSDKITIISSEFTINKALEYDEATIGRIYQLSGDYHINIDRDRNKNYRLRG